MLGLMSPKSARVHQVHVDKEGKAEMRLISGDTPGMAMGTKVLVEMAPGIWRRGHVDHRAPSGPGGVIMVTLER